jgi:hypothetical protein
MTRNPLLSLLALLAVVLAAGRTKSGAPARPALTREPGWAAHP